jgi:MFS family permease/quinol monooxygenase YgiN
LTDDKKSFMSMLDSDLSPFSPFKARAFRWLWGVWLVANLCMWMNDVAAAWIMTSLTSSPAWVALVQSSAMLPVFLLALPSGALADGLDRKKYFMLTQVWVSLVAGALALATFMDWLSPHLLLALVFANGVGLAMRWPVFAAILPELVGKSQLPAALSLNSIAMNISRIAGPLMAGGLIAAAGAFWVFALNAVLLLLAACVIGRWKREHRPHPLGREPVMNSIRVGVQYIAQSAPLKNVLLRIWIFFFGAAGLVALLPLVARGIHGGGAKTYTMLLAAMGVGAILSTTLLPRLLKRFSRDALVLRSALLQSLAMLVIALTDELWLALPAMMLSGVTAITVANALTVAFQLGLPDWVRARGMSVYFMTMMGSGAFGAALWGQLASISSISTSVAAAALSGFLVLAWVMRLRPDSGNVGDLSPKRIFAVPQHPEPPPKGHIIISVEYLVDPGSAADFRRLMMEESRSARLRQGALSWQLLSDLNDPGRFLEVTTERSWVDHLRRFERTTASDAELHERKLGFHVGTEPPRIVRYLDESKAARR